MGQTSSRLLRGRRDQSSEASQAPSTSGHSTSALSEGANAHAYPMTDRSAKGKGRAATSQEGPCPSPASQETARSAMDSIAVDARIADAAASSSGNSGEERYGRPRLFSKRSKQSSSSLGSSPRPSLSQRQSESSRSRATSTSGSAADRQSAPSSPSRERRTFMDKLKPRRLSSYIVSGDAKPQTGKDAMQYDETPAAETPSDATRQDVLDVPYVHAAPSVTPPAESDAILDERQRARHTIEAAGVSLQHGSASQLNSDQSIPPTDANSTLIDEAEDRERPIPTLDEPFITAVPSREPRLEEHVQAESHSEALAEAGGDASASLPSSAPTQPSAISEAEAQMARAVGIAEAQPHSPPMQSTSTARRQTGFGLPRRILVQGIVSRSMTPRGSSPAPMNSPRAHSSSLSPSEVPASEQTEPLLPHPPASAEESAEDSAFWDQMIDGTLSPQEPNSLAEIDDRQSSSNSAWDEAVAELLALPSEIDRPAEPLVPSEPTTSTDQPQPGSLIGRLLHIAAASTAATLLPPGSITINGQTVSGFDDQEDSAAIAVGSSRTGEVSSRPRSASVPANRVSPARSGDSAGVARPEHGRRGSGSLQTILQDALASALRTPPASLPTSPSAETRTRPIFSPALSTNEAPELLSNQMPLANASPISSPLSSPPATPGPGTRLPAMQIPIPDWSADGALEHGRLQPEGSFERFLADMQADVVPAVLEYLTQLDAGSNPERFVFFRSFSFPARPPNTVTWDRPDGSSGIPQEATSGASSFSDPLRETDDPLPSVHSSGPITSSGSVSGAANQTGTPTGNVVPMLFVGVRSIARLGSGELDADLLGDNHESGENVDPAAVPLPEGDDDELNDDGASVLSYSPSYAGSVDDRTAPLPAMSVPRPSGNSASSAAPAHSGFVMWLLGGIYPANHPLVIAPGLLSDGALSYDEMLRLTEVLGSVKPPTATQDEIKQSSLPVIKGSEVQTASQREQVLSITADRCLVCLEDYEEDDDVRILKCKHCFHQPCVDRWLAEGANTCPACRTEGVAKQQKSRETEDPLQTAVARPNNHVEEDIIV